MECPNQDIYAYTEDPHVQQGPPTGDRRLERVPVSSTASRVDAGGDRGLTAAPQAQVRLDVVDRW